MKRSYLELRQTHPALRLVLVPRHHERTADVEADLAAAKLAYVLRKSLADNDSRHDVPVLVVNTTGELMAFLAAADIVYVGKTLAGNTGGHNVIEPAIHGKAIVTGVHTENFRPIMEPFRADEAFLEVTDEAAFTAACRRLLDDPALRARLGAAARTCVARHRGATALTLDLLTPLIRPSSIANRN
jgi:3-deoxy-D-manno-octulosonic-acid transferase